MFATYAWFLAVLSTMLTGFFTGAMLLVALAILPYWDSLAPQAFHSWFVQNGHWLGNVMVPLLFGSLVLAIFTTIAARENRKSFALSAAYLLAIVVFYALYSAKINEVLLTPEMLSSAEISSLRGRWGALHWVRVILGGLSFSTSLVTLTWGARWR